MVAGFDPGTITGDVQMPLPQNFAEFGQQGTKGVNLRRGKVQQLCAHAVQVRYDLVLFALYGHSVKIGLLNCSPGRWRVTGNAVVSAHEGSYVPRQNQSDLVTERDVLVCPVLGSPRSGQTGGTVWMVPGRSRHVCDVCPEEKRVQPSAVSQSEIFITSPRWGHLR